MLFLLAALTLLAGATSLVAPATGSSPTAVIIGGGWAGFGAAWGLSCRGYSVTVLEASKEAVGGLAAGWADPTGRPIELGIHGFWRSYVNVFRLIDQLQLDPEKVFTPYAAPALYTKDGLSTVAPVFGDMPRLPTPLGSALYPQFERLPLIERASAVALLYEFVDFDGSDEAWRRYDGMSAREMFKRAGVSQALYDEFLEPMLLVLPMSPGEECSAAAALSLLQYFALAHQADFDVRWLQGSLTDLVFTPWVAALESRGAAVLRGKRVSQVEVDGREATLVRCDDGSCYEADAVIMSVGISGAKNLLRGSPALARLPEFGRTTLLRGVDCVAVRLWFRRRLPLPHASNVVGGGVPESLQDTGWTFYHLNELQPSSCVGAEGSIIEIDYYHAGPLLPLGDDEVVRTALRGLRQLLPEVFEAPEEEQAQLAHFSVLRAGGAVSHFTPGSFRNLPPLAAPSLDNFFFSGDWIDRAGHKSWSQEKALVTGLQAATAAAASLRKRGVAPAAPETEGGLSPRPLPEQELAPLEVEPDEPHVQVARGIKEAFQPQLELLRSLLPLPQRMQ